MTRTSSKIQFSRRKSSSSSKKSLDNSDKVSKPRRRKNGSLLLREIKFYQNTTNLLLRKTPFVRLIKEILDEMRPFSEPLRFKAEALQAIQESAEIYLTNLFELSNVVANNSKRSTVMVRDIQTVRRIRGYDDIANR